MTETPAPPELVVRRLTGRQTHLLDLVAKGYTNQEIAGATFVAEKTAKNYVTELLNTLGFSNRTQLGVWWAVRNHEPAPAHRHRRPCPTWHRRRPH